MAISVNDFSSRYESDKHCYHRGKATSPTLLNMFGSLFHDYNRAVSMLEVDGNKEKYICFTLFNVGRVSKKESEIDGRFYVEKGVLQGYLNNAKPLEGGKKGVYFEVTQRRNDWVAMITFLQLFFKADAKIKVEMIFSAENKLEGMRVHDEHYNERVLFSASSIRSEADIRAERRAVEEQNRQKNNEEKKEREEKRRFNLTGSN